MRRAGPNHFRPEGESLADSDHLPPPEVIAQEIVEDLAAAPERSRLIAWDVISAATERRAAPGAGR